MPDTIMTEQAEADRAYRDAIAEIDAERRATAEGASWFDEFTNVEEALRAVRGVAQILIQIGISKSPNQFDVEMLAYLGEQLLDHYEDGRDAFDKLHALHYIEKRASQT